MKKEERLFAALSGVSDGLLERSERRKTGAGRWIAWGAALAACLAVVLLVYTGTAPKGADSEILPPPPLEEPPTPQPTEPALTPPEPALPDKPEKLRWLQIAPQERDIPEFTLWINEESYYTYEQNGVYVIKPYNPPQVPDEELPECKMEIEYLEGTTEEVLETVQSRLESLYTSVICEEVNKDYFTGEVSEYYFRADNGTDWNSAQREVWLIPYREGQEVTGAFVLSSSYFLEAEEGHGVRFYIMADTFRAWNQSDILSCPWTEDLEDAALRLTKAVMSDDLSGVEELLAPDAEVVGPGEDLYAYVSIANISYDYSVWSGYKGHEEEVPEAATVSVQFRLGGEDSYSYLTMEMIYQDGAWLAEWIGIEK